MTQKTKISPDGSWKIVVDVFYINWFFYIALGVTTRVYELKNGAWKPAKAQSVTASGVMGSFGAPGYTARIPNSPNVRQNDSEADCRAWSVGVGITFNIGDSITGPSPWPPDPGNPHPGPGPAQLPGNRAYGSGSATYKGLSLPTESFWS